MANMQTYYVDLSLDNSYVGEGTELNKYSWGDVLRWFATLNASPGDTSASLDAGVPFDMSSMSVDFRMTGKKQMTAADTITVTGIQFFLGALIRFTSHDPATNGVAVWHFPSATTLGSFITVSDSSTADVRIQGVILRVEGAVGGIASVSGLNSKVTFENNVSVLSHKTKLVALDGAFSKMSIAGNTVVARDSGVGEHVLFSNTGATSTSSLSHNIIGQPSASSTALVGLVSSADGSVLASGNVWAIRPNGAPYTGVYPSVSVGAPDVFGQDLEAVIYGDTTMGGTDGDFTAILDSDSNSTRGCSEFTLTFARAHHTGRAIAKVPAVANTVSVVDTVGYIDITGKFRSGVIDAGAIQKSGITSDSVFHVDLAIGASSRSNAIGTESDPIGNQDWKLDLLRRAPVDNTVTYALTNDSSPSVPSVALSLGDGAGYSGAGSVKVVGWKTYNRELPALRVQTISINQSINFQFEKVHMEWIGSSDLFYYAVGGVNANANKFRVINSTLRSDAGNTGRLVAFSTQSPTLEIAGLSAALKHTSATTAASGYITIDSDLSHLICLTAIELGNQTAVLTAPAQAQVTGLFASSMTGTPTVIGAVVLDSVLTAGPSPFKGSSAVKPNFELLSDSMALGIISDESGVPAAVRSALATDCRDLERSAFPYGSTTYDAGAVESGYKTYPETHIYADLSKTSTGHVGSSLDKFSYADLTSWLDSLRATTLTKRYVVHLLRRVTTNEATIKLDGIEGNPYIGSIAFVTDNGKSSAAIISSNAPAISAEGTKGLCLELNRVIVGSTSGFGPVSLSAESGTINKLTAKNTILGWTHSQVGFVVSRLGTMDTNDYITVNSKSFPRTENSTDDKTDFAAIIAAITSDADFGNLVAVDEIEYGTTYRISPATSVDITINTSTNISSTRASALIDGDAAWSVRLAAVSIADVFTKDLSLQTTAVRSSPTTMVAVGVESIASGTSKTTSVATNPVDVIGISRSSSAALTGVTGTTVNDRPMSVPLFSNTASGDFDQDDFKLVGAAPTLAVISGAQVPAWASSINIDMNGSLRFSVPTESVDAGAMEYNGVIPTGTYNAGTQSPVVSRTKLGQAMHLRMEADGPLSYLNPVVDGERDINPFSYQIVGYQLLNAGYTYWQPTQPTDVEDFSGSQAKATITVDAGNSFDASTEITIDYAGRSVVITYVPNPNSTGGFSAGSTASETATNIASVLRAAQINKLPLESVLWVSVSSNVITMTSKLIGSLGNTITVGTSGSGLTSTTMVGGTDQTEPPGQVYPVSGWVPFDKNETPDPYSISFALKLGIGQANAAFGAITIMAQVISSPLASEVGTVFPFALVRMPLESKHERKTISCRVLFT